MVAAMICFRRFLAIATCVAVFAGGANARAECIEAPELAAYQTATPEDFALGPTRSDRLGRVVAPVTVNGEGPFRFIVDTGANRSVLSEALAARLGLAAIGTGNVHSVYGVTVAPLVRVANIQYGGISLNAAELPLLSGPVLAGAQGLLGVDGMTGRRLHLDFDRNCIEITSSSSARRLNNYTTLRGQLRFGHLVVVQGAIGSLRVNLFLDTGSDTSLANVALRDALAQRNLYRPLSPTVAYTAGETAPLGDAMIIPRMSLGDIDVRNVTAFVGDFHIFRIWELSDEPTLLLGMDVLSQTRGLAIDYERRLVHLRIRDRRQAGRMR